MSEPGTYELRLTATREQADALAAALVDEGLTVQVRETVHRSDTPSAAVEFLLVIAGGLTVHALEPAVDALTTRIRRGFERFREKNPDVEVEASDDIIPRR